MKIETIKPSWDTSEYRLIDSGDGAKLEQFGSHILARPEPQALWKKSRNDWQEIASATFTRSTAIDAEKGEWKIGRGVEEQWWIERKMARGIMKLRLGMTSFKHVGIFAEQAANWDFIQQQTIENGGGRVLNMFAYTGAASMAAALASAEVTHVDSVKAVNTWARGNAEASGISTIRYITDDAREFAARELRRDNSYTGIILDPPAYGRGPDGQKWVLEQNIYDLLCECKKLLDDRSGSFIVLNLYSMGFSSMLAHTLCSQILGEQFAITCGELFVEDDFQKRLPLGLFLRAIRK